MRFIPKIAGWVLLGSGIVFPVVLSAQSQQSSSTSPVSALNEQQRVGRRLFMQNCSFCHLPRGNAKDPAKKTSFGPLLTNLFGREQPLSEQGARLFILQGVPEKMPGFQYGLEPKEIDTILAYLKTL